MRELLFFGRVEQIPARHVVAFACQFVKARAAPQVGINTPVVLEKLGGGNNLAEDGAGTKQLYAWPALLAVRNLAFAQQVEAFDDVLLAA